MPADDLKRNVGISQIRAEHHAKEIADDARQDEPDSRVIAARANAKGRIVLLRLLPQRGKRFQWNLAIAVNQEHVFPRRNIDPGSKRLAVPSIGLMDHSQPGLRLGEVVKDPAGAILAAIIHYDQFGVADQ